LAASATEGLANLLYLFDNFSLDTDRRELKRAADLVRVEPQVFDLLEHLIRNRDRVVTRDDLFGTIWKGRVVSDATLSSRIKAARSAIGDNGEEQRLIRTLARKGIRFVGAVQEQHCVPKLAVAPVQEQQAILYEESKPSIAVLPFANISGDPEQDYFADGMAEEIITALSRCNWLLVIARNSSFTYRERVVDIRQIGRELGVRYVLEGSVRRYGNRLRIAGQLIGTASCTQIWADRFDGEMSDVFELQDRIAESVVAAIEPMLRLAEIDRLKRKPVENLNVYELFLRAQQRENEFTEDSLAAALGYLQQAIAIDPAYAPAIALAAYCHAERHFQGWVGSGEGREEGIRLAWRAVELGGNDGNVLWMAAFAIWTLAQDAQSALKLFKRSLLVNPNSAMALTMAGWVESFTGQPDRGRELLERARRLSPLDPREWFMSTGMAIACIVDRKFDEAVVWAEQALVQNRRFAVALRVLAVALASAGRRERAANIVEELLRIEPQLTISGLRGRVTFVIESVWQTYSDALRIAGLPE
jgi:TolB-like protein/tetratricopeptide (TPR) repeat protein